MHLEHRDHAQVLAPLDELAHLGPVTRAHWPPVESTMRTEFAPVAAIAARSCSCRPRLEPGVRIVDAAHDERRAVVVDELPVRDEEAGETSYRQQQTECKRWLRAAARERIVLITSP